MAEPRKCEICAQRPAKMLLVRRKSGLDCRTLVCAECGRERARLYAHCLLDFHSIGNPASAASTWNPDTRRCDVCGTLLADGDAELEPGCCECYFHFSEVLEKAVGSIQGQTRHLGKTPKR